MNTKHHVLQSQRVDWKIAGILAGIHVILHVATNGHYGIFRDELYYLACADHLAFGYVDHPPLSIALLAFSRMLFGDSVQAIRILPALAGAALVIMTALITAELGGKRFAQGCTAVCTMIAPSYLALSGFFSMNVFDLLFWAAGFYVLLRIINTGNQQLWLALGVVLGLGLLNKLSVLFFGIGLFFGLILTSHRKLLLEKYLWLGSAIAGILFLPHVLWQVATGWPTLEFMRNATRYKIAALSPLEFFMGQILEIHPLNALIWLIGLLFLLFSKRMRLYRVFGVMYVALFIFFVIQRSKVYYLAPAYPVLFAAGSSVLEVWFARRLTWMKLVVLVVLAVGGIATLPYALPVLPVEAFVGYQRAIGIQPPASENVGDTLLPQHFADRFGWENMARTVAEAYRNLPPETQADVVIFAQNYGEAGAMQYYRARYNLPLVISGHNNYFLWGYGNASGNAVLAIGADALDVQRMFTTVTRVATIKSPYAMPYETNLPVYLCSGPQMPLANLWPRVKMFI